MKILVCIAKVPDTTAKIAFTDGDTKFSEQGVTFIINPYDEWYALVRALELKEAGVAESVDLITVGEADADAILRKALAIGGDKAFRVNKGAHDPLDTATQIAAVVKDNGYDVVFTGKESIDYNNASVGAAIAGLLDYDYAGYVVKFDVKDGKAILTREIEGGEETDIIGLPLVVSCQKGLAEQRIPNMRGIMAARTKPLTVIEPIAEENYTTVSKYELSPAKSGVKLFDVDHLDDLVAALHNEAKVI